MSDCSVSFMQIIKISCLLRRKPAHCKEVIYGRKQPDCSTMHPGCCDVEAFTFAASAICFGRNTYS